jgi:hypothetical protein
MYLTKKQQEVLAYFLHLNYEECEVESTKQIMLEMLIKLQENRIFGNIKYWNEEY